MPPRRLNPNRVKLNRSYDVGELAELLGVHKNTVRHWSTEGLTPIDDGRPMLFHGEQVRAFLAKRNADRRQPCPPGTLYCFRCRQPREPALGMVDYVELRSGTGNLQAFCGTCEAIMHRRVRRSALTTAMPGIDVQITEAPSRLVRPSSPSLNCDSKRQGAP